jgi:hypothetical protein
MSGVPTSGRRVHGQAAIARAVFAVQNFAFRSRRLIARRAGWIVVSLDAGVAIADWFAIPAYQKRLSDYFGDPAKFSELKNFMLAIGAALIGATAIASSFVLFATQTNVERTPHGLFRRLGSDARLLLSFATAFTMAFAIAAGALAPDKNWAAGLIVGVVEGAVGTLLLFAYAYARALKLINPFEQLGIVFADARKEMRAWARRADRASKLMPELADILCIRCRLNTSLNRGRGGATRRLPPHAGGLRHARDPRCGRCGGDLGLELSRCQRSASDLGSDAQARNCDGTWCGSPGLARLR